MRAKARKKRLVVGIYVLWRVTTPLPIATLSSYLAKTAIQDTSTMCLYIGERVSD